MSNTNSILRENNSSISKNDKKRLSNYGNINWYTLLMKQVSNLNKIDIIQQNFIFVFTYLWMFKIYEARVCFEEEQLKMDFDNIYESKDMSPYYIPTYKVLNYYFSEITKLIDSNAQLKYAELILLHKDLVNIGGSYLYFKIQEIKSIAFGHSSNIFFPAEHFDIQEGYSELPNIFEKITDETVKKLKFALEKSIKQSELTLDTETIIKIPELSRYAFLTMFYDVKEKMISSNFFMNKEHIRKSPKYTTKKQSNKKILKSNSFDKLSNTKQRKSLLTRKNSRDKSPIGITDIDKLSIS
jgi:hypothetical protein